MLIILQVDAWGSTVDIYVRGKSQDCRPVLNPEENAVLTQYLLSPEETEAVLKRYFRGELNPDLYDAAIVNAGLKFCGNDEKKQIFSFIIKYMSAENPSRNVMEVYNNYSAVSPMPLMIQKAKTLPNGLRLKKNIGMAEKIKR